MSNRSQIAASPSNVLMLAKDLRQSLCYGARNVADEGVDVLALRFIRLQWEFARVFYYYRLAFITHPPKSAMTVEQNVLQQHSQKVRAAKLTGWITLA